MEDLLFLVLSFSRNLIFHQLQQQQPRDLFTRLRLRFNDILLCISNGHGKLQDYFWIVRRTLYCSHEVIENVQSYDKEAEAAFKLALEDDGLINHACWSSGLQWWWSRQQKCRTRRPLWFYRVGQRFLNSLKKSTIASNNGLSLWGRREVISSCDLCAFFCYFQFEGDLLKFKPNVKVAANTKSWS